jgi:thiamine pyrophosphokinase
MMSNPSENDTNMPLHAPRTSHILLFANGNFELAQLPPHDLIIAADGGARHVQRLGRIPHEIIGDLDSLSEDEISAFKAAGSRVHRFPPEKDETDLQLALDYAVRHGAQRITCYGLFGGRWDMTFANLLLLADPRYAGVELQIEAGDTCMYILRGGETRLLVGSSGDIVSVIPLDGPALGLTYTGLAWPLKNADLPFGSPRGVSNTIKSDSASVSLRVGVILIVHQPAAKSTTE